jgi:hypothetical protein
MLRGLYYLDDSPITADNIAASLLHECLLLPRLDSLILSPDSFDGGTVEQQDSS